MTAWEGLSNAHIILLATHLCASGRAVVSLPQLQAHFPHCLPIERIFRIILTFLPESTEPQLYIPVIKELVEGTRSRSLDDIDVSPVKNLSVTTARKQVRRLHLLPLRCPSDDDGDDDGNYNEDGHSTTDSLTLFLIHRAYLIDSETALQPLVLELLLPFYEHSPRIRTWLISSLLPLLRINYEYYPSNDEMLSLEALEAMDDNTAINVFLSMTGPQRDSMDLAKNLRGLVGPLLYGSNRSKRRRLNEAARSNSISLPSTEIEHHEIQQSGWESVNEWLLSQSPVDYGNVVDAFANWDGPEDVDLGGYVDDNEQLQSDQRANSRTRYGQTGLAAIYANPDSGKASLDGSVRILMRVSRLLDLEEFTVLSMNGSAFPSVNFDASSISSVSRALLLQNALLAPSNPFTKPSKLSISFLSAILLSLQTLNELGHSIPCRIGAGTSIHSNEEKQLQELQGVVSSITKQNKSRDWKKARLQLLWLRNWQTQHAGEENTAVPEYHGLFWRIPLETVEIEIFKALLAVREYQLAVDIYVKSKSSPLSLAQVETAVRDAIFVAYDNASNGNKTRGGMKRAHDILQAFQPCFPDSVSLKQIQALIAATHALSFYSLTLQHGVPFQPVSIRVHSDPLSLIEKVLNQNRKGYTNLDDLLFIGRNLVAAGLPTYASSDVDTQNEAPIQGDDATITAERRIISSSISSALTSNDFGTAYSYVMTRIATPSFLLPPKPKPNSKPTPSTPPKSKDDISWRAVYNAGRYRPPTTTTTTPTTTTTTTTTTTQITHLTQRMELLSLALLLTPSPNPLPEILGVWRRCDEELTVLHARESEDADAWDARGDDILGPSPSLPPSTVPGGFGPSDSERDALETEAWRARRARVGRSGSGSGLVQPDRAGSAGGEDEAPMGLFEVARGAAMAFRKNTFPLRGAGAGAGAGAGTGTESDSASESKVNMNMGSPSPRPESATFDSPRPSQDQEREFVRDQDGRVRKRDVVSNMVTGGLVSGIGWVLGAQPVNQREQ